MDRYDYELRRYEQENERLENIEEELDYELDSYLYEIGELIDMMYRIIRRYESNYGVFVDSDFIKERVGDLL